MPVGRPPDPNRKPKLTQQIADYLTDQGIVDFSLRSLAGHLGCSTYTLLYRFGTREQLLSEVIEQVEASLRDETRAHMDARVNEKDESDLRVDERVRPKVSGLLDSYWDWVLAPANLSRAQLSLEATLLRSRKLAVDPERRAMMTLDWIEFDAGFLRELGVPEDAASEIGTQMNATMVGLFIDLIATGDVDRLTRSERRLSRQLDEQVDSLIDTRNDSDAKKAS
jgi:AcrR family transcriptional regulator